MHPYTAMYALGVVNFRHIAVSTYARHFLHTDRTIANGVS
jgi:hypothetical protein